VSWSRGRDDWMSPTYDPKRNCFNVTAREKCDVFSTAPRPTMQGTLNYGSAYFPNDEAAPFYGALRALDLKTGKAVWEWKPFPPTMSGVLLTAGGVVFTATRREFHALDAKSGKALWPFPVRRECLFMPMTYSMDGKQYVVVAAGSARLRWLAVDGFKKNYLFSFGRVG